MDAATGAVSPPIHLSSTFERAADGTAASRSCFLRPARRTRTGQGRWRRAWRPWRSGAAVAAFASGAAATLSILQARFAPGDHVCWRRATRTTEPPSCCGTSWARWGADHFQST
ncbi:MAG: PLP-dependent transferase [Rhodopseudomonas palustris]|nr:PLP-dependent transferase [Rhodopseudomonas palustris]